jgi:hypothetical protein
MESAAVRPRRPRRTGWLADVSALTFVAFTLITLAVVAGRLVDADDALNRGFQLTGGGGTAGLSAAELASLDHPVDPDLEADWPLAGFPGASLAGATWWSSPDFRAGQGAVFDPTKAWRPHNPYRHLDVQTRWLNVGAGVRRTWQPPACDCPTVKIWMYGGSTTFGLNQRDEHTIASELAKVARADGLRLEVENHGQMGALHWIEAERFALELQGREQPDLVLFYDGVNDAWASQLLVIRETGDLPVPLDPTMVDVWNNHAGGFEVPKAPPGAELLGYPKEEQPSAFEQARRIVVRWDRARLFSQRVADRHGVTARYAWQPSRYSRDLIADEPNGSGSQENGSRFADQVMRDSLPDDVIDMVDVFDDNSDPLFTDDVHHNETGARIVAEALYRELEAELRRMASTQAD